MTDETEAAVERLEMLTRVIGVKDFGHLPIIGRENAGQFQSDLRAVLAELAGLREQRDGWRKSALVMDEWVVSAEAALTSARTEAEGLREKRAVAGGSAILDVLAERRRQVEAKGWSPAHDDQHDSGELANAAACYAAPLQLRTKTVPLEVFHNGRAQAGDAEWHPSREERTVPEPWPWDGKWWKPRTMRENLVRAAALIIADIERIDRAAAWGKGTQDHG